MTKSNSSGVLFDVDDLRRQVEAHILHIKQTKDSKYTIEKAMKKISLAKSSYYSMLERGVIRITSIKKFMKLSIVVKPKKS